MYETYGAWEFVLASQLALSAPYHYHFYIFIFVYVSRIYVLEKHVQCILRIQIYRHFF